MHQKVNFYIGALVITIVGSFATYLIVHTGLDAETQGYAGASASSTNPEIPRLEDELKKRY